MHPEAGEDVPLKV